MNFISNLNLFAYHTVEVLLCDIKLAFLKMKVSITDRMIAELEAELAARRA